MSEVLYRKYRPERFEDVLGQDHIVEVLRESIKNSSIAHAYLFSGGRGTGKTTLARIVAKEVGCTENDLYEIDAASNRGIDDIRELRDAVSTLPFESPYKVYIIDEVHMLSKSAFNPIIHRNHDAAFNEIAGKVTDRMASIEPRLSGFIDLD